MIKKGFTLAEVLITLGIIGVVAALTAPALVKNSGQAKIGPSMAKFVNTVETAAQQLMYDRNMSKLTYSSLTSLANYMIMTPYENSKNFVFTDATGKYTETVSNKFFKDLADECHHLLDYEGTDKFTQLQSSCGYYENAFDNGNADVMVAQLKDGMVMAIIPVTSSGSPKGSFQGAVAEVLVDIDGDKDSNKAGKDVFSFVLDKTGTLIPTSSKMYKSAYCTASRDSLNVTATYARNACSYTCDKTAANIAKNLACTGQVADNGWKADY